jgi:hypothetical protein
MSALLCHKYPGIAKRLITLDNKRMALPLQKGLKVCSLRASDQLPDEGVLPNAKQRNKYKVSIVQLENTPHDNMSNIGTESQLSQICSYILRFL